MIYVVIKPRKDGEGKMACIVKAKEFRDAKIIAGVTESTDADVNFSGEWAGFTEREIETILAAKEGYIAKDL